MISCEVLPSLLQIPMSKRPNEDWKVPSSTSSNEPAPKKRLIPDNAGPLEGMTKVELQTALKMGGQSFKELKEIAKKLEKFPPVSREEQIDPFIDTADLVMKKYPQPQIFVCHRCDHVKTSNMKAKYKTKENICGSCFDHITRCIIPYKGLPEYQKPKQCIHKIPKTIQKMYRS
jgi:hypothetical protein